MVLFHFKNQVLEQYLDYSFFNIAKVNGIIQFHKHINTSVQ